jgi:hypothetical protein
MVTLRGTRPSCTRRSFRSAMLLMSKGPSLSRAGTRTPYRITPLSGLTSLPEGAVEEQWSQEH